MVVQKESFNLQFCPSFDCGGLRVDVLLDTLGGLLAKSCPTLAIPWTVACQVPLSMEFSEQEYWSGLPFPSHGIFPTQESNPGLLHFRQILY